MKKSIFLGLATFAMLLTTSCVNEIAPSKEIGDTPVTFQIGTPEIATRAYSDGTTATKLQYAVYDEDGNILNALTEDNAVINGSTSIELQLATGNEYSIIFWAAAPNAPYTINFAEKTMTVNYEGAVCNDETRDAFYKCHTFTVRGAQTETIELKRPFAQLNIGTNDYEASEKAGYKPAYSYVKVPVYSVLNLFEGTVDNSEEVEFALSAIPTEEEFPVKGYEYISMNYLLVSADKEVVDVTFGYSEDNQTVKTRTVGSVPVQRNYRTNIYGQLFTSGVDVNVTIDPDYEEPANNVDLDATVVTTSEEMVTAFANGGKVVLANDTIVLDKTLYIEDGKEVNLDLNGKTIIVTKKEVHPVINMLTKETRLTITGNGRVEISDPGVSLIYPRGNVVIENGTFIRKVPAGTPANQVKALFEGIQKVETTVTIKDGYFDGGYYDANAADVDEILAGTKTLTETDDDKAKRGTNKDANKVRVALKNNIFTFLNSSSNKLLVYGGTFVGANPAWGDEGCMLPTNPNYYLRPWSHYQGALLDGQNFNENGLVLPAGYEITKGTHADGRPTYTVTYNE